MREEPGAHSELVALIELAFAFAALGLFAAAIANIVKGRLGTAIVFGVIALVIGGAAGAVATYA